MNTNKEVTKLAKQIVSIATEISNSKSYDESIFFCDYIINLTRTLERTVKFKQNEIDVKNNKDESFLPF